MTDLLAVLALRDLFFTAPAEARLGDTLGANHDKDVGYRWRSIAQDLAVIHDRPAELSRHRTVRRGKPSCRAAYVRFGFTERTLA
jgi:hypothetical protein